MNDLLRWSLLGLFVHSWFDDLDADARDDLGLELRLAGVENDWLAEPVLHNIAVGIGYSRGVRLVETILAAPLKNRPASPPSPRRPLRS